MVRQAMNHKRQKAAPVRRRGRADLVAITVRLPREEYEQLREQAELRGVSLNCLAAEALAEYNVGEKRRKLLKEISAFRATLKPFPEGTEDSAAMLRRIRLERAGYLPGEDGSDES
jgi:hypothetical protein